MTITIAAHNANPLSMSQADYVCDGTADDRQINDVIDALLPVGGKIRLSEGTFNISAPIDIGVERGLSLHGSGWGTILKADRGFNDYIIKFSPPDTWPGIGAHLAHFKIDGNIWSQETGGGILAKGSCNSLFENIWFTLCYESALGLTGFGGGSWGYQNKVISCGFDEGRKSMGSGQALRIEESDENTIQGCTFKFNGGAGVDAYHIYDLAGLNNYAGNNFVAGKRGIHIKSSRCLVTGNQFDALDDYCVYITSGRSNIVASNAFYSNVDSSSLGLGFGPENNLISGNSFVSHKEDGRTASFIREAHNNGADNLVNGNIAYVAGALSDAPIYQTDPTGLILAANVGF